MAYRLTDTEKWSDSWFTELDFISKGVFQYLCDNCDIAGFYELSKRKLRNDLHPLTDEQIRQSLIAIEKSYIISRDKTVLLLKNFVKHQKNTPLNHRNPVHRGIFARVENYKDKFAHNLVKIINQGDNIKQDKVALKGLQSNIGIDIGSVYISFNVFYDLYDYKINKKQAEDSWNKLKLSEQKEAIEKLPRWKEVFKEQIKPHPATWLNNKRWEDDLSHIHVIQLTPKKEEPKVTITSNRIDHRKRG